jgi:PAS domain S-box-containing protein
MPLETADHPYHHLFDALPDGVILNDAATGRVVEANPAAAALHGYDRAAFIGLSPAAYMQSADAAKMAGWVAAAQAGETIETTAVHLRPDGTSFTVETHMTGCVYRDRPCLLSVVRDISARVDRGQQDQALRDGQVQALAALEERRRLAQNLHDAVNQSLFSASLIAEVLPRLWELHPQEVKTSLEDLRRLTRGALAEMRGLLVELQPLDLADSELGDLLRLLADAYTGRTNIPVILTVAGQGSLPGEVHVAFYRLCQEALNNIAKHAGAGQVLIDLRHDDRMAELSIRDDGRGFDPDNIPPGHFGLTMMQERARDAGAALSISSQPGEGTKLTVHWPAGPQENEK